MTDRAVLRERVAKDRYEKKRARLLEAFGDTAGWPEWENLRQALKDIEIETYAPVIDLVLEEAARVVRRMPSPSSEWMADELLRALGGPANQIPIAIRALKSGNDS